jgi:hypothetical protein
MEVDMHVDRYTKAVLTVIAVALVYIGAMLSGVPASAQGGAIRIPSERLADTRPQPVVVVGWGSLSASGEIILRTINDAKGVPYTDPILPVRVQQMPEAPTPVTLGVTAERPLPVGLTAVVAGQHWEPVRTKVEPAPTSPKPGGGQ